MLHQLRPDYGYAGKAESVISAISLLKENHFDLIFMDIDLGDGFCFDIFEQVEILTPIIFTTAHNEFVMRAFEVKSFILSGIGISIFGNANGTQIAGIFNNIHSEAKGFGLGGIANIARDIKGTWIAGVLNTTNKAEGWG